MGSIGYTGNIVGRALGNSNFREVIATGPNSQIVVMALPTGGEIGLETHGDTDQILVLVDGEGSLQLDSEFRHVGPGTLAFIPAGTSHNLVNRGSTTLRLYTIYAPPAHAAGTVHRTKAEADLDELDQPAAVLA
jgi:mannose-6-phosphate isomerase-like protein (cupin superfamily)